MQSRLAAMIPSLVFVLGSRWQSWQGLLSNPSGGGSMDGSAARASGAPVKEKMRNKASRRIRVMFMSLLLSALPARRAARTGPNAPA